MFIKTKNTNMKRRLRFFEYLKDHLIFEIDCLPVSLRLTKGMLQLSIDDA